MGEEKTKTKLDEYGQLAGGYDLGQARAWALAHAKRSLRYRMPSAEDLELAWEVPSCRFVEEQDCYEVAVSVYPQEVAYRQKAEWVYHITALGELMPGTPVLRTPLGLREPERGAPGGLPLGAWMGPGGWMRRGGC
ncbi:MAG: hypothetical protein HYY01_03285 [Chloroflexi bacterium]|nr:hypothetical protein [Chloroflexota bacterium]